MRRPALLLLAFVVIAAFQATPAAAQTCNSYVWGQTTTSTFTFVYQQQTPLGEDIATTLGAALDDEYARFAALFQTSLPTPLTIRLYPRGTDYTCLNALAPTIPSGQTHSHIGAREIVLIGEYIQADPEAWQIEGLEVLRHELAILFAQQITGGKIPLGLEMGLGLYAEDPALTFERHLAQTPPPASPSATWRSLWEAPDVIAYPEIRLQTASIVAYLVDVYGWDKFITYLNTLRTAESYRTALTEVYETELDTLETQWQTYYPYYLEGRWRTNLLYEFSLSTYEQLLTAGAYQAAHDGLPRIILLLTQREDHPDLLSDAERLLATADTGLAADALARQAHQAYQEGSYPEAIDFATNALDLYASLEDSRNQETLTTLQTRAQEILALRAELAALESTLSPADAPR
ncbi:MAG TPA: peptidase MA family metallohydrolase, partial [Anaerolineales bacterium]|nr:peptidase MA family metallohydrolase [Anaerolineales bacterium]